MKVAWRKAAGGECLSAASGLRSLPCPSLDSLLLSATLRSYCCSSSTRQSGFLSMRRLAYCVASMRPFHGASSSLSPQSPWSGRSSSLGLRCLPSLMRRRWGLARQNDGKLLLITNAQDLSLQEVIDRSTSLADIERRFAIGQNLGWGGRDRIVANLGRQLPDGFGVGQGVARRLGMGRSDSENQAVPSVLMAGSLPSAGESWVSAIL